MFRFLVKIVFVITLMAAAPVGTRSYHRDPDCGRSTERCGSRGPPAFAFAPAGGTGMGTACACAAVTGTKGETLTLTRASSGTCLKGSTTTGIANGDMVTCSSNQPRVGTGGSGGLKLLVEDTRTNTFLRSNEFDNAAWVKLGQGGPLAPVVTADQAVAPDGTTTADQLALDATTGAQRSVVYQIAGFNGPGSISVFVKGTATSPTGTIDVCSTSPTCVACSFVQNTWTLCKSENGTQISAGTTPFIGNTSSDNGGTPRPAQTVYLAMANFEAGSFVTSYIATAGSAATRAVDSATFPATAAVYNAQGSSAASVIAEETIGGATGIVLSFGANNRIPYLISGSTRVFDAINVVQTTAGANWQNYHRLWSSWASASMTATNSTDSVTASGTFDTTMQEGSTTLSIGSNSAAYFNGWIGEVCLDPNPNRCR